MSTDIAALVQRAEDPAVALEARAAAALEAIEGGTPRFDIDADVVSEVARLAGFRRALTAAWLTDGPHRAPNLERALALKGDHPGDEGCTAALLELGRLGPELIASLLDEFRRQAAERPPPSPMFLGAWGIHLVKAYRLMGDRPLRQFVWAAAAEDDDHFSLITEAIGLAPLDEELEELRASMQYLIEMAWSEWYTSDLPADAAAEAAEAIADLTGPPAPPRGAPPAATRPPPREPDPPSEAERQAAEAAVHIAARAAPPPQAPALAPSAPQERSPAPRRPVAARPPTTGREDGPEALPMVPVVSRLTWFYFVCLLLPWLVVGLYVALRYPPYVPL